MINEVSLYGDRDELVQEPPLVVIEVYDEDTVVRVSVISLVLSIYMFLLF